MAFLPSPASQVAIRWSAAGVEIVPRAFARVWRNLASSSFNGVYWNTWQKKFQAKVSFQGKLHHVGYFHCENQAAHAYDERLRRLCQDGARLKKSLNFPSLSEATYTAQLPIEMVQRVRELADVDTFAKEEQSFRRLQDRFLMTPQALTHEIIRVSGSSRVDALYQFKGCDIGGVPLQLKAASASGKFRTSYAFTNTRGYDGMLLVLIALDRNRMWVTPGSAVPTTKFTIRLDSERDEAYRVIDLGSTLQQHFQGSAAIPHHISLRHARLWCSKANQVEEHAHRQMAALFASAGFHLDKAHTLTAVDSVLVGVGCKWRVQEKASSRRKHGGYEAHLHKGTLRQAYSDSDFDLLLAALLEGNKLTGLFLFPTHVLCKHGFVGGKPAMLRLWPPWNLPVREKHRVKNAWQLDHFVDLQGWSESEVPPEKASNRLAHLLRRLVQTAPASESTRAVTACDLAVSALRHGNTCRMKSKCFSISLEGLRESKPKLVESSGFLTCICSSCLAGL